MKILIESTTFNHKLYHSLSLGLLEELKMNIEFGIVRSDDVAKKFLLKQKEIKYKFFENDYLSGLNHLLLKDKKKFISLKNKLPEPDYEVLDEFERSLDGKSIWKIISSDRFLGRSFLTGVIGYDNDFKSDRKFILKVFSERIKKITEIFKEFQPSIFLPMVAGGSIELFIYYYLCKKFNVFYAIHFDLRTKNLFSYTSNLNYTFPLIEKDTKLYLENKSLNSNITLGKELYKEIINNLNKSDYFNIEKRKLNVSGKIRQNIYKFKILLGLIKNFPKFIKKKYSFRNYILAKSQNIWLPNLGKSIIGKYKYIYYPLHSNPEYSTSVMGVMWQDQISIIEALAKSIPNDWVLYVKEHPGVVTNRIRPYSMYRRIAELPNVVIAPVYENTNTIIKNAEMVAVVTGTAGWEAILRKKPVIHFVDVFYQCLNLSKKCSDINTLSNLINNEYKRINEISDEERDNRIICFLSSFINNGFYSNFPHQLLLEDGTNEQYKEAGKQLSLEILKYIKKIDSNFFKKFK